MKTMQLTETSKNQYTATYGAKEAHNIYADTIFNVYSKASSLLDIQKFAYDHFELQSENFNATWNSDLDGYEIIFSDGKRALTQANVNDNKLSGGFGESFIERYTEYDDDLSDEQDDQVDDFVSQVNSIDAHFGDGSFLTVYQKNQKNGGN